MLNIQSESFEPWWKRSVVYQVYPRSFMDANGDGIGDLQGIILKLDYLQTLGVDVIWLSPIYDSPNDDNGYDIRDYYEIMKEFGTMEDFEEMVAAAHARGIRIIMDLVVNHTSDEHQWFVESKKSKDSPYHNYYFWRDRPNNWGSFFGGSAWEYNQSTDEHYLHIFSRKQPDLNWDNPEVRNDVYRLMEFWLEKKIDGFRMDVINFISKSPELPDAVLNSGDIYASGAPHFMNGPRVHEYLQEMNQRIISHYDVMTVGETPGVTTQDAILYTDPNRKELNMVFHFEHMDVDSGSLGKWDYKPWELSELKEIMSKWQEALNNKGWNSLYLNNHDQPRMVSRFGDDGKYRVESAKMLATFLHMQQGTPFIYQGEEIGMVNVAFTSIEDYQDIETLNMWNEQVIENQKHAEDVLRLVHRKSRDNARTPMQWNRFAHGGFTSGTPWLKVNPRYQEINVIQALEDPDSVFYYYQKLIQLRKDLAVVVHGQYELLIPEHEEIYAYVRKWEDQTLLVICNFFSNEPEWVFPEGMTQCTSNLLLSNYEVDDSHSMQNFTLRPYEARIYLLDYSL